MRTQLLLFAFFSALLVIQACGGGTGSSGEQAVDALTEAEEAGYRERGQAIALATFTALSGQLQQAMAEGGVAHAAEYCKLAAYPLVDSLSELYQAQIRRTSFRVRNPIDAPTNAEAAVLQDYAEQEQAGEELKPRVERLNAETVAFYAPIRVQGLCLSCHGEVGETLSAMDYETIKALYPQDEAVGYRLGDLRGMWTIQFRSSPAFSTEQ